jgi:hypothetical protein
MKLTPTSLGILPVAALTFGLIAAGPARAQFVEGPYIAGAIGMNYLDDAKFRLDGRLNQGMTALGQPNGGQLGFDFGGVGLLSFGWGFSNGIRLEIEGDDFQIKLHGLLEQSFELPELQWLSKFNLDVNEKQLLIIMAANHLHFPERSVDVERILQRIEKRYYLIAKDIMNGRNILMRENLITFSTTEFKTLDEMKLSDKLMEQFGLNKSEEDKPRNLEYGQLIFPEDIEYKRVFYNKDVESQMSSLKKIIDVFQNNETEEKPFRSVKLMIMLMRQLQEE